jgi:hypothetical protein
MKTWNLLTWSVLTMTITALVACGEKKDETNKGRPAAPGGSPAVSTPGRGAGPSSTGTGTVSSKLITLKVQNIRMQSMGYDEDGSVITMDVDIDGTTKKQVTTLITEETQNSAIGQAGYFVSGNYVVTYAAKCNDVSCGQYFISFWVSDATKGVNEYQLGLMKDFNGILINSAENSDQLAYQVNADKTKQNSMNNDVISLDAMIEILQQSSNF